MKSKYSLLLTAAMVVAVIRAWEQLRGKAKTPFPEWAVGWGATFFLLSLLSDVSPEGAGMLAWIIVVSEFLAKGTSLTKDVSGAIVGAEQQQPLFVDQPLATMSPGSVR